MPSFDIVSKVNLAEVDNAINGAMREVGQRYDFKGSGCTLERADGKITILADDDYKLGQMQELLKVHVTRRKLDARSLSFGKVEEASGNMVRQQVTIRTGIDQELAKRIVKEIKSSKTKVQAAIQGDELRISGKKRDDLQGAIALIKGLDVDQPLQYVNFRD
jgi:uncharacterized protein YajQ (UPF0234 family)